MKKYFLFLCFLFELFSAKAQKITRVELLQSDSFIGLKRNGESTNKVIRPVFRQDNATLTCDSAYFYIEKNSFEAFGNVHINQSDTVNVYADHLNYNGNTKSAILTNNVKLTDNEAILTTNNLDYNLGTKIGRYTNGGKIVNGVNTLTSENGFYFTNSKDAYFRYKVLVKSPDVLIKSDTLKYNTLTKIAYFFGPTNIYGKTDTLYTENGQYDTATDVAKFGKNNLYTQNSKSLKGDSLFYDGKLGYGRAVKNIVFIDTAQKGELRGDLGIYTKSDESIMVTRNAYIIFVTEKDSVTKDSVWMTGDTLRSKVLMKMQLYTLQQKAISVNQEEDEKIDGENSLKLADSVVPKTVVKDSIQTDSVIVKEIVKTKAIIAKKGRPEPIDIEVVTRAPSKPAKFPELDIIFENKLGLTFIQESASIQPQLMIAADLPPEATDTTKIRVVSAYKQVKIFKSDFQARADSAFFSYGDSVMRLYQKPMVWAQGSQISADTMYVQMKNKKIDNMDMIRNSIVVKTEKDSLNYDQVAGKMMKGYFKNDNLDVVFVNGNAESIYFSRDSSGTDGMMRSIASRMRIQFEKDSLMSISFLRKPEHTYYPNDKVTEELSTLPNFNWKPKERPKSKVDIIPTLKPKATVKKPAAKPAPVKKQTKPTVINDKVAKPALVPKKIE